MKLNKKIKKDLNIFLKSLFQSGVLDWTKKLKEEFPQSEVYLVGGAVRDIILEAKANKDYDFVVRKISMKRLKEFLSKLGWVEELGKNFGVLKFRPSKVAFLPKGTALDIALPRSEFSLGQGGYKDFRVKFDKNLDIKDDLLRRDFTINAIALKLTFCSHKVMGSRNEFRMTFKITDPFNGISDINNKIIKCIDNPEQRLKEDYTRILRAVRLSCQLNFKIENKTKQFIKKLAPHLNDSLQSRQVKVRGGYKNIINYVAPREIIAKELLRAFLENHLNAFELYDKLDLFKVLMPEILKMKKCPQPKNFHSEGDVWQHTKLALEMMESKKFKMFEKKLDGLFNIDRQNEDQKKLELIFGVLFHDLGKPYTIQTPKKDNVDRIRFYEHDLVGAGLANKICRYLALSTPPGLGIDYHNVSWLVRNHMILMHGHPSQFRSTTIEKYFFSDKYPGINLIKLAYLDSLATVPKTGKTDFSLINALLQRIKEMKTLVKKKQKKQMLPPPLLNGDEIMKILKIKPGKKIGEIKDKLREKQLSGKVNNRKDAEKFINLFKLRN